MFNFDFGGMGGGGHSHGPRGGGRSARAEVDTTTFYTRLGVEKTATEAEIKKAFRKQAMTHHPDRGGNAETFKNLNTAYEALSDPAKRALYDEGGEEALADGAQGGGGGGMGDIFDMFGGGMFGGGGGRGRGAPRVRKGDDVTFPLKVTLEDCYNGCAKKLRLTKNVICQPCGGKGGKGGKETKCPDCKGQGARMVIRQIGPGMIQQAQVTCSACKGSGSQIAEKDRCPECLGQKTVKEKKTLDVHVSKGMAHGAKIIFSGEADQQPDQTPGDVVVILQQVEHGTFRREGANLFHKRTLTLLEALTGFSFPIHQLDGRTLLVKADAQTVIRPGDVRAIKDEGMPQVKNPYVRGNLYVEFDVVFPTPQQLTESTKKVLRSVLPPAAAPSAADAAALKDPSAEQVTLVSVDFEAEKKKFEAQAREEQEEEEEDDEGHGHGGGQPQCRQQ